METFGYALLIIFCTPFGWIGLFVAGVAVAVARGK
jgi:hypothetical protein